MLRGHTFGVSAGLGLGIDGSLGISYAPVNIDNPFGKDGGFINVGGQIGIGIQGSPTSGINLKGNYQYAPIAKPIFKFK